jgi:hypothetical protein
MRRGEGGGVERGGLSQEEEKEDGRREGEQQREYELGGGLGRLAVDDITPETLFPFQKQQLFLIKGTAWPQYPDSHDKTFPALVIKTNKGNRLIEYVLLDESDWDKNVAAMGGWKEQHPPRAVALQWMRRVWGKAWPANTDDERNNRQYQLKLQDAMTKAKMVFQMKVSPQSLQHVDGIVRVPAPADDPLEGLHTILTAEQVQQLMMEAYGGHLDTSTCTELDTVEGKLWLRCGNLKGRQYRPPSNAVGKRLVRKLADEIMALVRQEKPSEWIIIFQTVILQSNRMIMKGSEITKTIARRLDMWDRGEFEALVTEAERCNREYLIMSQKRRTGTTTTVHTASVFNKMLLQGKVSEAVRLLSDQGQKGGVLKALDEIEIKGQKKTVQAELEGKHPAGKLPHREALLDRPINPETGEEELPAMVNVQVTPAHVEKIARKLKGGAGPGGTDAAIWQHLLLYQKEASLELQAAVAALCEKLATDNMAWKLTRALFANRLVALDKCPGVRPIGIGECLRRILGKMMAYITREDVAKEAQAAQLAVGVPGGIEAATIAMNKLFDAVAGVEVEGYGMLLVDAANAFNAVNRAAALWNARILWPRCARFLFNSYRGFAFLLLQATADTSVILLSREGVTQGDPLSMFLYSIAIMPLIRKCTRVGEWHQCWYADDSSAVARLRQLVEWLTLLMEEGPKFGYFPEPAKSILIVHPAMVEEARRIFTGPLKVKVVTGARFLGGFVGEESERRAYVAVKTKEWTGLTTRMAEIAELQPQAAYTAFRLSLSAQWSYLLRVVRDAHEEMKPLETAIATKFLPALLGGHVTEREREVFSLPARMGGMGVRDPSKETLSFVTACEASRVLVPAIKEGGPFDAQEHKAQRQRAGRECREKRQEQDQALYGLVLAEWRTTAPLQARALERAHDFKTASILTDIPLDATHTALTPLEFVDHLTVRYNRTLVRVPATCDGRECRGVLFTREHALECKFGGKTIGRHNAIRDQLGNLLSQWKPGVVREPIISTANERTGEVTRIGDLVVRGVFAPQQDAYLDIRVTHTDASSYRGMTVPAVLKAQEREKRNKHGPACSQRRAAFVPVVMSVDGALGEEAEELVGRLAAGLAAKWGKPLHEATRTVRLQLAVASARGTSQCIRGARTRWFGLGDTDGRTTGGHAPE